MKRTILTVLIAVIAVNILAKNKKDIVLKQSEGSITFVVDKNLPAPAKHLYMMDGEKIARLKVGEKKGNSTIVSTSFDDARLFHSNGNVMFDMLMRAYAEHRPVVLSPDDVWLCISQGFAEHVNKNAETLRSRIVNHEGQMELKVETSQPLLTEDSVFTDAAHHEPIDWPGIFDGFVQQMKDNTKGDVVSNMSADYSTTTVCSRIASQITLMYAMQPYFKYSVEFAAACGIPYITLRGTAEDWQKVLNKARSLEQYDLKWWTDKLCPVLEQFVKTAQGKPDHQFWRCMMTQIEIDKMRGGGCSGIASTTFDGWFLCLFPYDKVGRTPARVTRTHEMLNSFKSVGFLYRVKDNQGNPLKETPMKFHAGFVGIEEDTESYELSPRIGWLVRRNDNAEQNK